MSVNLHVVLTFLVAKRFKNFRRFVYDYEAEIINGVNGATDNKSGPKVSCKVGLIDSAHATAGSGRPVAPTQQY